MDITTQIYQDTKTVFRTKDVSLLTGITDTLSLNRRLNYYVKSKKLLHLRKGIYAKPNYDPEELAGVVFSPSYLSLDYVLQKAGVIFQFDSKITAVSYLSREITIDGFRFQYRKIKSEILVNTKGIIINSNFNIATPERAFLDLLYLEKDFYFDHLEPLDKNFIQELLPIYQQKTLTDTVTQMLAL